MKDEEVKVEETEDSHTLGGWGRWYADVIHTEIHQSHRLRQTISLGCDNR